MQKSVLITGASRGIGKSAALEFSNAGYAVCVNYLNSEKEAHAVVEEIVRRGGNAFPFRSDVSVENEALALVKAAQSHFSQIDVLVNNAGVALDKLFTETRSDEWLRVFDVNIHGAFYCSKFVLPQMISQKRGKILNVSSVWGMVGASCEVAYSASKAALIGLTKALAKELGPSNIQVNCVAPGVIDTDMNCNLTKADICALCEQTPLGKLGKPEDIAALLVYLASDKADFLTGQVISPNGGFVI
ncbi:MAG TPA: 3-oxoacyl-ACP reductase FabG [Clostridia bacterium]|nr:3-oxoacyl-ACP reductase FabG [Clostridia bacterium]